MPRAVIKIWIDAARPRTLPAAAAPVIMGTALAVGDGGFHAAAAAAAMLGALLILPALVYVIKPKFLAKSTVIVG